MGCEHSTTIRVQPLGESAAKQDNSVAKLENEGATNMKKTNFSCESTLEYYLDPYGNKVPKNKPRNGPHSAKKRGKRGNLGSNLSLENERSLDGDRGFSATSKASADSGLGGEDHENSRIITEYSNEDAVRKVEESFVGREDLELGITGVQLPTRLSAKDRARQEESSILQALREEGLIAKPTTESSGGMCFEIVTMADAEGKCLPLLPLKHLENLEKRRKKKRVLTEEEIKEKLERAERRRKKREEEKLNRIKDMEKSDVPAAMENFEQHKKIKVNQQTQKMDIVTDNREKILNDIKDKIKERETRAEEVRWKRKQKALEQGLVTTGIIDNEQEYPPGVENPTFNSD